MAPIVAKGGEGSFGGCDGIHARCGCDGRTIGLLEGNRGAVLPYEAERLKNVVLWISSAWWCRRRIRYVASATMARSHRTRTTVVATNVVMETEVVPGWRGPIITLTFFFSEEI